MPLGDRLDWSEVTRIEKRQVRDLVGVGLNPRVEAMPAESPTPRLATQGAENSTLVA